MLGLLNCIGELGRPQPSDPADAGAVDTADRVSAVRLYAPSCGSSVLVQLVVLSNASHTRPYVQRTIGCPEHCNHPPHGGFSANGDLSQSETQRSAPRFRL